MADLVMSSPRWYKDALVGDEQRTPSGAVWRVTAVSAGGRVLELESVPDARVARVEASPEHPDYPSDEAIAAKATAERRAAREARRRAVMP